MKSCHRCGTSWEGEGRPPFREVCEKCQAYLHACLNCRFYDRDAYHQCREPRAEHVQDKQAGNFCEFFEFREGEVFS